jgi:2-aminoadipate transaminase
MNWLDSLGPLTRQRDRRHPMYARIVACIRENIFSGNLSPEERLPPDRELASLLKLDRSTVARAYDELEAQGLVSSHVGRGTFVRSAHANINSTPELPSDKALLWDERFSQASQNIQAMFSRVAISADSSPEIISFARGIPGEECVPLLEFQELARELCSCESGRKLFSYSPSDGLPELKHEVRHYLKRRGLEVRDDELLILGGSQQGIDLVSRTFLNPDDAVIVEEPSYFLGMANFVLNGARLLAVPVDESGLRLDALDLVLSRQKAKLLYVMPSFQNPSSCTMPLARRKALLNLAAHHHVAILEDNYVSDLSYDGPALPWLKTLAAGDNVICQGTFSKALCPGLRLGWIAASANVIARLKLVKRLCDLSTSTMSQAVLAEYLRRGLYERHLQHMVATYRQRRDAMVAALNRHASELLSWQQPAGGFAVWARLWDGASARELLGIAERNGVTFSCGDSYFAGARHQEFLRLSFVQVQEPQIEEGVRRLSAAIKTYLDRRSRRDGRLWLAGEDTII